ncbi:proteinase inhibitor PSI-1.2-like [Vicia villosa]|uniref:proteinase inhibitor PSI-1.2-like n=1 Tax=Vicia villosa TaxID=3911 RepID=UPI00273C03F3|nr:proteinase inhibitor PSI-1.2-like [Vicia villosa]XP_058768617.1 proteinase inhibitor PSI-1.2-like [Vicia villosa]
MALKVETILLVIVFGAILLGGNIKIVDGKVCQFICNGAYMTCPSSGDEHLNPACNCCFASTGCTIYKADGTPICTAT